MKLIEIMEDHFRSIPGVFSMVMGKDLMISWFTVQSYMDSQDTGDELHINQSRDHLLLRQENNEVWIRRVDNAERILKENPWKVLDIHDPRLLYELEEIVRNL